MQLKVLIAASKKTSFLRKLTLGVFKQMYNKLYCKVRELSLFKQLEESGVGHI